MFLRKERESKLPFVDRCCAGPLEFTALLFWQPSLLRLCVACASAKAAATRGQRSKAAGQVSGW